MRTIFKPIAVWVLAGTFLAGSVLCCCVRHVIPAQVKKSCCHKSSESKSAKAGCDGCSLTLKSAVNLKVFDLAPSSQMNLAAPVLEKSVFKPAHTIKPVFIHGPPGPIAQVPLYTRFHALRI